MKQVAACLVVLVLSAQSLFAQTYPEYTEIYVNDFADLLDAGQEENLRDILKDLREQRQIEFTVVTINQMSDYGYFGAIEPFATGLFNKWGIGDAQRNDGIMLLISRYDRELRIEVGSGYGRRKDNAMKVIIDDEIVPLFKQDKYAKGIERGVQRVIYNITGVWPGEFESTGFERKTGAIKRWFSNLNEWFYLFILPIFAWPYRAWRRWRRNKPRHCPVDGTEMRRLDELMDDQHLQKGQTVEEHLKSVDYDVWHCDNCDHVTIESYRAWFSSYGACRACNYRTLEGDTTIVKSATTSSTGLKRTDYYCHNCQEEYSVTRTIAKKSKSSSSSSSSFGGGSSSGGGASGSW